jgi:hypothetical protein
MHEPKPPAPENKEPSVSPDKAASPVVSIVSASTSFMSLAAEEWLNFLIDQPVNPPFEHDAKFNDESKRIARLVVIVVVLSTIVVGGGGLFVAELATMQVIRMSIGLMIGAFLVAIFYKPFAFVFGIRIINGDLKKPLSLRQILFPLLYTFAPWLPIFAFLYIAINSDTGVIILILIILAAWFCSFYLIYNFAKTIMVITKCRAYQAYLSLVFPLTILGLYVLFGY